MREVVLTNEVEKFILKQRILIADTCKSSRVGIARALCDMGAQSSQMTLVDSYVWAEEIITQAKPGFIVLDYHIDSNCGIDLLQDVSDDDRFTVVVTHNSSQAAVARAAEGDVDAYITKPYTIKIFNDSISQAIIKKLHPTEYVKTIHEGRLSLKTNQINQAIAIFEKAASLNDRPALAYYYKGFIHQLNRALEIAQASFSKGLEYNELHYKCMIGLHEALLAQNKIDEAYDILRRMFQSFPLKQGRFELLLKLAIQCQRFDEVKDYHDAFLKLDLKNDEIVKCVCAALITAGKHFIKRGETEKALNLFQKAAVSAGGRMVFLREIILTLAEEGHAKEIDPYLCRVPQQLRSSAEFLSLDYFTLSLLQSVNLTVDHGRRLIKQGVHDPLIYRVLAKASLDAGLLDSAEKLALEGSKCWPEKKDEFQALLTEIGKILNC